MKLKMDLGAVGYAGLSLAVSLPCKGQEIKPDPLFENRYERRDGSYLKRDPLFENRINEYDRSGRKTGTWREDDLINDRWKFKS